jgi:tetratricopeptide (TPR) repeat protein
MTRALATLFTLALLGAAASADCLILKRGGRTQVWGMPASIGQGANAIEITPENAEIYADQSTGIIWSEGYDVITAKKGASAKEETFPRSEVVRIFYTTEPDALVSAYASMADGNFLAAVNQFKQVVDDPNARPAYKYLALRQIGLCYYAAGRVPDCIKHFQAWPAVNARQTPEVYRFLADLLTEQRNYDGARAQYDSISKLPGIPDVWKFNARLGGVKVDTAERKYDAAEQTAAAIARESTGKADVVDAHVLALVLQAEAIWRGGKEDRLPEATSILERAAAIDGPEPGTRAFLFLTQGNVLYAQRDPDKARFPYLRAALMYPDSGYDGIAYFNAGLCFLDLSGRYEGTGEGKNQELSDKLFVDGMKLLATAAGTYKQADAAKRYREPANKQRYEAIMAKQAGGAGGTPGGGGTDSTGK